jgi:hypothetical protein
MIRRHFELLLGHWEVTLSASLNYLLSVDLWQHPVAPAGSELVDTLGPIAAL